MHKVIIATVTVLVAGTAIFMFHARQTTASEHVSAAMPSIHLLTVSAAEMPQQSFPAC
jgi:hypothetical protein